MQLCDLRLIPYIVRNAFRIIPNTQFNCKYIFILLTFTRKLVNAFVQEFVQICVSVVCRTNPRDRFFAESFHVFMVSTSRNFIVLQQIVLTFLLTDRKDFLGRWDEFAILVAQGDDAIDTRSPWKCARAQRSSKCGVRELHFYYINSSTLVRRLFESRESFLLVIFSHGLILFS